MCMCDHVGITSITCVPSHSHAVFSCNTLHLRQHVYSCPHTLSLLCLIVITAMRGFKVSVSPTMQDKSIM